MRMPFIHCRSFLLCMFLVLMILGFGILDLDQVSAENALSPSKLVEKVGDMPSPINKPYHYEMGSRRDPFVPLFFPQEGADSERPEILDSEKTVDSLTLLGVISGTRGYQALVKLPNGERVVVEPGSYLDGIQTTVKRITRDAVVIAKSLDGKTDMEQSEKSLLLSP